MNNQPVDQDSNEQAKLPNVSTILGSVPFFSLFLYIALVICKFINWFPDEPYFANSYEKTIANYQVWRLFTSLFYSTSLIMICIIIMNMTTFLHQLENRLSTPVIIVQFIVGNLIIQLICLPIQYLLRQTSFNEPLGVCGIWFNMMLKFCYYNNEKVKFCCFPFKFSRLFYPYILFAIITLFSIRIRLEMVIGILLGIIQCLLFRVNVISCPICFYNLMQRAFRCLGPGHFSNWTSYPNGMKTVGCWVSGKQAYERLQISQRTASSNSLSIDSKEDYFKNKKGVTIQ